MAEPAITEFHPPVTKYGRLYAPDPRDRMYALVPRARMLIPRLSIVWRTGPILDQGASPQCVGFSWYQFLLSAPVMKRSRVLPSPSTIYHRAQEIDEWPGTNYEGSSVRAGAKALCAAGVLKEYRWALNASDLKNFVLSRGPLVVGTDWFSRMSTPKVIHNRKHNCEDSYLEVDGSNEGGHAWEVNGYSNSRDAYRMTNSWGTTWGEHGRAWIERKSLEYLIFSANGEACSAVEAA